MRDPKQSTQADRTSNQQPQTSITTAEAGPGSAELVAEELEERIAPVKQILRRY
jgi:hypothetical protein